MSSLSRAAMEALEVGAVVVVIAVVFYASIWAILRLTYVIEKRGR